MHRVVELADREPGIPTPSGIPYRSLIPFNEVIAQAVERSSDCKSVWDIYFRFIHEFENEHKILTEIPIEELACIAPERISQAVDRMRKGQVKIVPGHDGVFGRIHLFNEEEGDEACQEQLTLF